MSIDVKRLLVKMFCRAAKGFRDASEAVDDRFSQARQAPPEVAYAARGTIFGSPQRAVRGTRLAIWIFCRSRSEKIEAEVTQFLKLRVGCCSRNAPPPKRRSVGRLPSFKAADRCGCGLIATPDPDDVRDWKAAGRK